MKVARLTVILLALGLLAVGCDSQTLLGGLLGSGGDTDGQQQPPMIVTATPDTAQPLIVTATPNTSVIVVTATPGGDAIVDSPELNMRSGPSTWFRIIGTLDEGEAVTVLGKNGNFTGRPSLWLQVRDANGQQGWIAGWLVRLNIDLNLVPVVATPVPPPTFTPTPTNTPVPTGPVIEFWADATRIPPGTCVSIHWRTERIREVFFEGIGVTGSEDRTVCPGTTDTYILRVVKQDGAIEERRVTIYVGDDPYVSFRVDDNQIGPSECTTIRWDVEGVSAVYFEGSGVIGHSTALVCPGATKTYTLSVLRTDSTTSDYYVTIQVDPSYGP